MISALIVLAVLCIVVFFGAALFIEVWDDRKEKQLHYFTWCDEQGKNVHTIRESYVDHINRLTERSRFWKRMYELEHESLEIVTYNRDDWR